MAVPTRTLATLAFAWLTLCGAVAGQQIDSIVEDIAALGDVIRLEGSGLVKKSRVVLVQDGELVKKTRLKVMAEGDGFIDVAVKKGLPGSFQIAVRVKKDLVGTSPDEIELAAPLPESVEPGAGIPGDEVTVMVRYYGVLAHKVTVGTKKAKIIDTQVLETGDSPLTAVTFKVPKVADGNWPVSVSNRLGTGTLKNALMVGGGTGKPGKIGAVISLTGMKPFKAKKKLIGTDEGNGDPGEVYVGLVGGSKKRPQIFGITIPGQLEDLSAGDEFTGTDEIAAVQYTTTNKDGSVCAWVTQANAEDEEFAIQVVSIDEDQLVLFVCGKARLAEKLSSDDCPADVVCFSGLVVAPGSPAENNGGDGACSPMTTATGGITGSFVSSVARNEAIYGLAGGPNVLLLTSGTAAETPSGTPLQVIEMRMTFNPATSPTPATFDSLFLDGTGLHAFNMIEADTTAWAQTFAPQAPPTPASMSVTIDKVVPAAQNPFGILGCIHGSFTGSITRTIDQVPQSFSGSFEIPWYSTGFGN